MANLWTLSLLKEQCFTLNNIMYWVRKINLYDSVFFIVLYFYLLKVSFGAVLKYYLLKGGVLILNYIPIFLIIVLSFFYLITNKFRIKRSLILFFFVWVYIGLLGLLNYNMPHKIQVFYGLYLQIPVFLGIVGYPALFKNIRLNNIVFFLLLLGTLLGLSIDFFMELPWETLEYEMLGANLTGSRVGSYLGLIRPGGFTGQHWIAASCAFFFSLYLMVFLKRKWLAYLSLTIGMLCILITFTKSLILIFIFISVLYSFRKYISITIQKVIYFFSLIAFISYPIFIFLLRNVDVIKKESISSFWYFFFYSLFLRVGSLYEVFNLKIFANIGFPLLGMGAGSLGASSVLYDKSNPNACDNMLVYFWGIGGLILLLYLLYNFINFGIRQNYFNDRTNYFIFLLAISIMSYGTMVNYIEFGLGAFMFGLFLSSMDRKRVGGKSHV